MFDLNNRWFDWQKTKIAVQINFVFSNLLR